MNDELELMLVVVDEEEIIQHQETLIDFTRYTLFIIIIYAQTYTLTHEECVDVEFRHNFELAFLYGYFILIVNDMKCVCVRC